MVDLIQKAMLIRDTQRMRTVEPVFAHLARVLQNRAVLTQLPRWAEWSLKKQSPGLGPRAPAEPGVAAQASLPWWPLLFLTHLHFGS